MTILDRPPAPFSPYCTRFPTRTDTETEEDEHFHLKAHTYWPLHHQPPLPPSFARSAGSGIMQHGPLHRRDTDPAVTDTTMFSVSTSPNCTPLAGGTGANGENSYQKKKRRSLRKRLSKRLPNIFKRDKKRPLSEAQLRKKLKKAADKGDWDVIRKLISGYEFSESIVDNAIPEHNALLNANGSNFRGSLTQEDHHVTAVSPATRRPSYGCRERRSFTGKESVAAAAVIKAAALEESSGSHNNSSPHIYGQADSTSNDKRPNFDENILHDVCRRCPPLDVLETLLAALRHRRGCTAATDDRGMTPLHLAAAAGAAPTLIDALVRADPSPTSMGDEHRRSPLHLAVKMLVDPTPASQGKNAWERVPKPSERLEQTFRTIQILKEAMLTYPGQIDFKDEDATGYSPLDYVIEAGIQKEELIQTLIRRKEPRWRRSLQRKGIPRNMSTNSFHSFNRQSNLTGGRSVYSGASSITEDLQDIEILQQLEQDEVEARRSRIEKIKERRRREERKAAMNDALFDVFGIEEVQVPGPLANDVPLEENKEGSVADYPPLGPKSEDGMKPLPVTTEDDAHIYNRHLQDYLDDYMEDFEGGDLGYCDEDGFDIFQDPEEDQEPSSQLRMAQAPIMRPPMEVVVSQDNDCVSLVSEVTAPLVAQT